MPLLFDRYGPSFRVSPHCRPILHTTDHKTSTPSPVLKSSLDEEGEVDARSGRSGQNGVPSRVHSLESEAYHETSAPVQPYHSVFMCLYPPPGVPEGPLGQTHPCPYPTSSA